MGTGRITHGLALTAALAVMWWVLSGHTEPLILAFGVLTVLVGVGAAWRMGLLDREGAPYQALHRRFAYWTWLGGEIAKANIAVVKLALRPDLDITPRLVRMPARQTSPLGVAVFANSITLTPGTVSVDVEENEILVHAIDGSIADFEAANHMGARVAKAFDSPVRP